MVGGKPQVDVEWLVALGQRQHEITAGQWPRRLGLFVASVGLIDQLVAVQHIQVELAQIGSEHPQQLFMLAGREPESQP
ncbi:hypothetical protein D3C75_1175700 [compost metagenome]